jgi:hypothetical protein
MWPPTAVAVLHGDDSENSKVHYKGCHRTVCKGTDRCDHCHDSQGLVLSSNTHI